MTLTKAPEMWVRSPRMAAWDVWVDLYVHVYLNVGPLRAAWLHSVPEGFRWF